MISGTQKGDGSTDFGDFDELAKVAELYDNGLTLPPSPVAIGTPGEAQASCFVKGRSDRPALLLGRSI